jgi:hypothetical protein
MQAFDVFGSIAIARTLGTGDKGIFTYAVTALALILAGNGQSAAIAWQYTKRNRSPTALVRVMIFVLAVGPRLTARRALEWEKCFGTPLVAT